MSERGIKFCLSCWLFVIVALQSTAILYLMEFITFQPVEKFLNKCGENYFFSTILIKDDQYSFDDVAGCDKDVGKMATCIYSVKDAKINNYYNQNHGLDQKTKEYLNSFSENKIAYSNDMSLFRDRPAIDKLLNSTLQEIKSAWFVVRKNNGKVNKVLVVTSVRPKAYCNQEINRLLLRGR